MELLHTVVFLRKIPALLLGAGRFLRKTHNRHHNERANHYGVVGDFWRRFIVGSRGHLIHTRDM